MNRRTLAPAMVLSLAGCGARLPPLTAARSDPDAEALVSGSAAAHGLDALGAVSDVAIRYEGRRSFGMDLIQPDLVDSGHRGVSEVWTGLSEEPRSASGSRTRAAERLQNQCGSRRRSGVPNGADPLNGRA